MVHVVVVVPAIRDDTCGSSCAHRALRLHFSPRPLPLPTTLFSVIITQLGYAYTFILDMSCHVSVLSPHEWLLSKTLTPDVLVSCMFFSDTNHSSIASATPTP